MRGLPGSHLTTTGIFQNPPSFSQGFFNKPELATILICSIQYDHCHLHAPFSTSTVNYLVSLTNRRATLSLWKQWRRSKYSIWLQIYNKAWLISSDLWERNPLHFTYPPQAKSSIIAQQYLKKQVILAASKLQHARFTSIVPHLDTLSTSQINSLGTNVYSLPFISVQWLELYKCGRAKTQHTQLKSATFSRTTLSNRPTLDSMMKWPCDLETFVKVIKVDK